MKVNYRIVVVLPYMASTFKGESQSGRFSPGNPGRLCSLESPLSVAVFGARGRHCAVFYPHRLNLRTCPLAGTVTVSILYRKKLRHREVKPYVQGYPVRKWCTPPQGSPDHVWNHVCFSSSEAEVLWGTTSLQKPMGWGWRQFGAGHLEATEAAP